VKIESRSNDNPATIFQSMGGGRCESKRERSGDDEISLHRSSLYIPLMVVKTRYKGQGTSEVGGRDGCILSLFTYKRSESQSTQAR
jgi:hypothetical protein